MTKICFTFSTARDQGLSISGSIATVSIFEQISPIVKHVTLSRSQSSSTKAINVTYNDGNSQLKSTV